MRNDILNNEIEIIRNILEEKGKEHNINMEYFHIGMLVERPNQCGCFKKVDKWYVYESDEKNYVTFCGPFTLNGIIYACAMKLHISKNMKEYRFSEEEFNTYLHKHFYSYDEL